MNQKRDNLEKILAAQTSPASSFQNSNGGKDVFVNFFLQTTTGNSYLEGIGMFLRKLDSHPKIDDRRHMASRKLKYNLLADRSVFKIVKKSNPYGRRVFLPLGWRRQKIERKLTWEKLLFIQAYCDKGHGMLTHPSTI